MQTGWCVRVTVFDDLVVSISERELAGRDLSEADEELIRDCARHLLSFVGAPAQATGRPPSRSFAIDPSAQHRERCQRAPSLPSADLTIGSPPDGRLTELARDRLWCEALLSSGLSVDQVHAVTKRFNEIRKRRAALLDAGDVPKSEE